MNNNGFSSLPIEIVDKILQKNINDKKCFATLAGVCTTWKELVSKPRHWHYVAFETGIGYDNRRNVNQIRNFCKSGYANHVRILRLEGFIVTSRGHTSSTVLTNNLLKVLEPSMPNLLELHVFNANIGMVEMKMMPASLCRLRLTGCIINFEAFAGLQKPTVLPHLEHLDLSYVHNVNSEKDSFSKIPTKRNLRSLELRHCNKITHPLLSSIASSLPFLTILNLSEIAKVDDAIMMEIPNLVRLEQLYIAFTSVTNIGIGALFGMNLVESEIKQEFLPNLKFLDMRGCFKLRGTILSDIDQYSKSMKEMWIYRTMEGFQAVRELLKLQGSQLRIQDEVDLGQFSIGQTKEKYNNHFNDREEEEEEEIIEEMPVDIRID